MIKAVFFDLDGTLLPMDQDVFVQFYFSKLARKLAPRGYEPKALIRSIWAGVAAMVANDGGRTNEAAFWDKFAEIHGQSARDDEPLFREFYANEFNQAREVCGFEPMAAEIVRTLKEKGYRLILATTPIFPAVATENRIRWAGLAPEDFECCTTYENASYSKPNPDYYRELLNKLDLRPEEVVMVGNDVAEDMVAATLGMRVFLLTPCLINKDGGDISVYPHGDFGSLMNYVQSEL